MVIPFNKYHGTGNDFIIIDNRACIFNLSEPAVIKKICDRRLGIGADGLIVIGQSVYGDFRVTYYNSDGHPTSLRVEQELRHLPLPQYYPVILSANCR